MLDAAGLDIDTLNQRVRAGLAPAVPAGDSPDINPVGHQHGPFWYRGHFDQHAATWGKATPEQVQRILDRHGVDHIVIGHTLVSNVGTIDDTGQVNAIDVKWQDPSAGEGLLLQDGMLRRLTVTQEQTAIKLGATKRR